LQLAWTALDLLQLINHHCFLDLVAVPFCHGSEISFAFWQAQSLQKAILTAVFFSGHSIFAAGLDCFVTVQSSL